MVRAIKKKRLKRLLITSLVGSLIIGSAYILGWSSLLSVKSVSITGSNSSSIVINKLKATGVEPKLGTKLARVDVRGIKHSLSQLDWLASSDISRNWVSKKLSINVVERVAVARSISAGNKVINFDNSGSIFTPTSPTQLAMQNKLPQVSTQGSGKDELASVAQLLRQIPAELNYLVTNLDSISVTKSGFIIMSTQINSMPVRVNWGLVELIDQKSAVLATLLKLPENQQIKQVDLSQADSPIIS